MTRHAAIALPLISLVIGDSAVPVNDCPLYGPSFPATFNISSTKA